MIEEQFRALREHGLEDLVSRAAVDELDARLEAEEEEGEVMEQAAAAALTSQDMDTRMFPIPASIGSCDWA